MSTQKKFRKADKKEVSSLVTNRLGKTEYLAQSIAGNPDNVYLTDDLVILIRFSPVKKESGILEKSKLAIDNAARGLKDFSSKIENIGGREVYVIDEVTEGLKVYRFTTVSRYAENPHHSLQYSVNENNYLRQVFNCKLNKIVPGKVSPIRYEVKTEISEGGQGMKVCRISG